MTEIITSFDRLKELVAIHVMGWTPKQINRAREFEALWAEEFKQYGRQYTILEFLCGEDDGIPDYPTDIEASWQVVEKMVSLMGYDNPSVQWYGPLFKPEHHYLTAEGYPLGTTCWYVELEVRGRRFTLLR